MAEINGKRGPDGEEPEGKRLKLESETNGTDSEPTQQEQERAVGISEYVAPQLPGFTCVVKQRYTDFLVNEILLSGEVLHLKELPNKAKSKPVATEKDEPEEKTEPEPESKPAPVETVKSSNGEAEVEKVVDFVLPEGDKTALESIFGSSITQQIVILYKSILAHPTKKPRDHPSIDSEVIAEKTQRTEAHLTIRRIFDSRLLTETLQDKPGVISIRAAPAKSASAPRGEQNGSKQGAQPKGRVGWDQLGGEYLHFTLYKENKDTMEVLYFMASQLKLHIKNFQFAGTKDRRGVTVQRVAIFRTHAERIKGLNRLAKGWVAADFEYKKNGLELGELLGNEFLLTLRDVRFECEKVDVQEKLKEAQQACASISKTIRENGFINYYGLQRFGTFSTGTHMIGMKMLKGDLEAAVNSLLEYDSAILDNTDEDSRIPQENIARAQAIKDWRETGELRRQVPRRFQAEASIMEYLSRKDRKTKQQTTKHDWQGALMQIQRNLRLMYVHAYQSLVWNTAAGHRWKTLGDKVVAGDLVINGEKDSVGKAPKDEVDADGEPIFHPAAGDSAPTAEDKFVRARALTEEEASSGVYNVFDIVLPLPGYDVNYPANEIGKFYEEFMGSEAGGGLDPHSMRRTWKDISLSGGYRKLLARPGAGFDMQVKLCNDPLEQLVRTDKEQLEGDSNEDAVMHDVDLAPIKDGQSSMAMIMRFQLGSSQYATMALRELTKGGAVQYVPDFSAPR